MGAGIGRRTASATSLSYLKERVREAIMLNIFNTIRRALPCGYRNSATKSARPGSRAT